MKVLLTPLFIFLFLGLNLQASSDLYEKLSGQKKVNFKDKSIWDKKFGKKHYIFGKAPERFLTENYSFLPKNGKVLDLGMGEGRHAVFLAQKGLKVVGIDISSVAIKKAKMLARENNVSIETIRASADSYDFKENSFDAIICFYYVDRELNKKLRKWLRPGGIMIYEGYTTNQQKVKGFERKNRMYMLKPLELKTMFDKMEVLKYEEPLDQDHYRASAVLKNIK